MNPPLFPRHIIAGGAVKVRKIGRRKGNHIPMTTSIRAIINSQRQENRLYEHQQDISLLSMFNSFRQLQIDISKILCFSENAMIDYFWQKGALRPARMDTSGGFLLRR